MVGKMKAVRLFAPGDIRCVEIDRPVINKDDDVIIKVKACGVCGSDIIRVMEKGAYYHPITIGHEFSGIVDQVPDKVSHIEVGDRVTVMPLIPCGKCRYCQVGEFVMCDEYAYYGSRMDGAMAEYIKVSVDNILPLPVNVDFEEGSTTDPASVSLHAIRKLDLEPGQNIVVFGMGAIGLITIQWLKEMGAGTVIAVDIQDEKLELAKKLGADITINGKKDEVVSLLESKIGTNNIDAAIELAGNKLTQVQAIDSVRKMGAVVYCGISYSDLDIPNSTLTKILRGELIIKGSWNSSIAPLPVSEWGTSLDFMNMGKLKINPIISHRYRLEKCQECFDMMYKKREVFNKVLFKPED
jgi:L-iditol 2-dehydrogenase